MGRFKDVLTEDGWRKLIRIQSSQQPSNPRKQGHHSRRAGTHKHSHSFSKWSKCPFNHWSHAHHSNCHGSSQNPYRQTTPFTSLFPIPKPLPNTHHISCTAIPPLSYKPPPCNSKISRSFSQSSSNMSSVPKKRQNPPMFKPPSPHTLSLQPTMTTPGRSYANVITSSTNNNIYLIQAPNRCPMPIWKSYVDKIFLLPLHLITRPSPNAKMHLKLSLYHQTPLIHNGEVVVTIASP